MNPECIKRNASVLDGDHPEATCTKPRRWPSASLIVKAEPSPLRDLSIETPLAFRYAFMAFMLSVASVTSHSKSFGAGVGAAVKVTFCPEGSVMRMGAEPVCLHHAQGAAG